MSVKAGSFSVNAMGNASIANLTFLPTRVFFRVGPTTSSTDTTKTARSDGWMTANNQSYDSIYEDSTGKSQKAGTDKAICLQGRPSGTITDIVAASFVSFDTNTPTNFGFTLNFTAFDSSKQIRYMADDA